MRSFRSKSCNFTKNSRFSKNDRKRKLTRKNCTCEGSSRRKAFSKVAWVLRSKNCFITHLTLANSLRVPPRNTKQQPALFFAKPIIGKKNPPKAKSLQLKLIHLFARAILLMKKLKIKETTAT